MVCICRRNCSRAAGHDADDGGTMPSRICKVNCPRDAKDASLPAKFCLHDTMQTQFACFRAHGEGEHDWAVMAKD
jgi:hypothetical protein